MKLNLCSKIALAAFVAIFSYAVEASAQQTQDKPDIFEQSEMEADRLQRLLDLEDWQVFYVDSTLKHDYPAMIAEYEDLQKSKVMNTSMYQAVQDKWIEHIEVTYKRIFTDEQWAAYLKSGAGKAIKAREKRKAKAQGGSKK
jgi:hypothetical protein